MQDNDGLQERLHGPGRAIAGGNARLSLVRESGRMALGALWANKLRTSLTLLGIIIGVSTVVAMASVLAGLDRGMAQSIASLGSGVIYLTKFEAGIHIGGRPQERRPDLTIDDARQIARACPAVAFVSPCGDAMASVSWRKRETKTISIAGAGADELLLSDRRISAGRFFTRAELLAERNVCVLGPDVVAVLFGSIAPVGRRVRIGRITYQVIGVLEGKGSVLGNNLDEVVVVPITALQRQYGWGDAVDYITILPISTRHVHLAEEEVEEFLRRRRGLRADAKSNFGLTTQENLLELYNNLTRAIYAVMLLVSGVALLVGGIGIMNMMLVTVKERTREIGIRRALGARRGDVMLQFLAEAMTLTLVGGALGIALGGLLALLLSLVSPLPAALPMGVVAIAVVLSASIGLFFGLYPAWRAAVQSPIEALRYE
jgi:putative ABC transport system permease protein